MVGRIGEFWLPGCWVDAIPELIRTPETFFRGLIAELDQLVRREPDLAQWDGTVEDLEKTLSTIGEASRYIDLEQLPVSKRVEQESVSGATPTGDENDFSLSATEPLDEPDGE